MEVVEALLGSYAQDLILGAEGILAVETLFF
jgi:hypothetical protein